MGLMKALWIVKRKSKKQIEILVNMSVANVCNHSPYEYF